MRRPFGLGLAAVGASVLSCGGCTTSAPAVPSVPVVASNADPRALSIGNGPVDTWGGWLPDGRTLGPFDAAAPPVARLDPNLLGAVQAAARTAREQGVDIALTSGWRSRGFQQRLFAGAVRQYGSVEIAQQFVATPEASKHVLGQAVDVAGPGVSDWLIANGAQFGLCQIYANENWHFELAVDEQGRCPPLRLNAAG